MRTPALKNIGLGPCLCRYTDSRDEQEVGKLGVFQNGSNAWLRRALCRARPAKPKDSRDYNCFEFRPKGWFSIRDAPTPSAALAR